MTMDVAFILHCSPSISTPIYQDVIKPGIFSMMESAQECSQNSNQMALVRCQSYTDNQWPRQPQFTSSLNDLEEALHSMQTGVGSPNACNAIEDGFRAILNLNWRHSTEYGPLHEKLVILITDGPPCILSDNNCSNETEDLWRMADELLSQNITLVILGIEPLILPCDDFYCALAEKTGGEYLPLQNAFPILTAAMTAALRDADTFQQLIRDSRVRQMAQFQAQYNYAYADMRVRDMIETCTNMTDIQREFFPYRSNRVWNHIHEIAVKNQCWDWCDETYFGLFNPRIYSRASTPTTDDEGYRTGLPTTASSIAEIHDRLNCTSISDSDELF